MQNTKYLTQEAMLFAGRPTSPSYSPSSPAVVAPIPTHDSYWGCGEGKLPRTHSAEKSSNAEIFTRPELETQYFSEVQPVSASDRSIQNYIFYDSSEESPQRNDFKKLVTAKRGSNYRDHAIWAEPLKPKWLRAIGRDRPGYMCENQTFVSKPTLDFKSKIFSWNQKEVITRIEMQSTGHSCQNEPTKSLNLTTPLASTPKTHCTGDSQKPLEVLPVDNSGNTNRKQNKQPQVKDPCILETTSTLYQKWLIVEICQQLCYVHLLNTVSSDGKPISVVELSDSKENSVYEVSSSNEESMIEFVEMCDEETQMDEIKYEDRSVGTDEAEIVNTEIRTNVHLETKATQTGGETLSIKDVRSCAVQTENETLADLACTLISLHGT